MTQIPKKLECGYGEEFIVFSPQYTINAVIDYLTAREELEDKRYIELTSRIDTITGNQSEMKRGKRCPEEDFGFEPKDQPKRCLQHFLQIDPTDGYQIVSYGFETREAAEAYKAKLLADNQQ